MKNYFDAYGPFDVIRDHKRCAKNQSALWDLVEGTDDGLAGAIGCYMFCLRWGKDFIPSYVGKTGAKLGFRGEVFTPHKVKIFNYEMQSRGYPQIFLFPLLTRDEKEFANPSDTADDIIKKLETMLIGFAYRRNPYLANIRETVFLEDTTIRGVFGEPTIGKPARGRAEARRALFGRPTKISS